MPAITGVVTEDETLTADASPISDIDGLGTFSYQWLRDGVAISGATAVTYTLGDADVGARISVQVGFTDGQGTNEGPLTSAQTAAVANVNDAPTIATNSGATFAEGSTGNTITSAMLNEGDPDDDGAGLTYQITAVTSNGTLRKNGTALVLNGTFTQADINSGAITYDHDGSNTLSDSFGFRLADGGEDGSTPASATFLLTVTPVDDDAPTQTANAGSSLAEGGTAPITATDLAFIDTEQPAINLTYTVTAGPANGQLELTSSAGVAVTSFTQDDINSGRLVYVHDGSNTTSDNFTFNIDDGQGNSVIGQAFAISVSPVNDVPVGLPSISGNVVEGEVLTADTSGISDGDGLGAFGYQWLRDGAVISGATASTYTLADGDVDTRISVQVSYTDSGGTSEGPLTSAQTAAVTQAGGAVEEENNDSQDPPNPPRQNPADDAPLLEQTLDQAAVDPQPSGPVEPRIELLAAPPEAPAPAVEEVIEEVALIENVRVDRGRQATAFSRVLRRSITTSAIRWSGSLPSFPAVLEAVADMPIGPYTTSDDGAVSGRANASTSTNEIVIGVTKVAITAASVGYIVWVVRGGTLFASVVASPPPWMSFDPLSTSLEELQ